MVKIYTVLAVSLLGVAGCAESYTVHVNGYAQGQDLISPNARIRIVTEPNAPNPLFDNEIKGKIVKLLSSRGFLPVDDPASEYTLTFRTGILSHLVQDESYYGGGGGFVGRHHVFINGGYYVPYIRTEWDQWLQIEVLKGDKTVWVGEASTSKYYTEKRRGIDYLLVGVFEFFGQDTHRLKTVEITEKDPRIAELKIYPQ
jgi:hypothetical protein